MSINTLVILGLTMLTSVHSLNPRFHSWLNDRCQESAFTDYIGVNKVCFRAASTSRMISCERQDNLASWNFTYYDDVNCQSVSSVVSGVGNGCYQGNSGSYQMDCESNAINLRVSAPMLSSIMIFSLFLCVNPFV